HYIQLCDAHCATLPLETLPRVFLHTVLHYPDIRGVPQLCWTARWWGRWCHNEARDLLRVADNKRLKLVTSGYPVRRQWQVCLYGQFDGFDKAEADDRLGRMVQRWPETVDVHTRGPGLWCITRVIPGIVEVIKIAIVVDIVHADYVLSQVW